MLFICVTVMLAVVAWFAVPRINLTGTAPGTVIDSLHGVYVYCNGPVNAVYGRNTTDDGYNIGLRYQCVEFVKRYYLYRYGHRMPDAYGHARDFYDKGVRSGGYNSRRGLVQYANGAGPRPETGDLVVYRAGMFNPYGHVAIVAATGGDYVEVIQQNGGRRHDSRKTFPLEMGADGWRIGHRRIIGWLRMPAND
ncbi:MAG: CHAP domain-containing protein [Alistipes sp.]|nr:CHAP domain-containing protein [Alistipes sp.]